MFCGAFYSVPFAGLFKAPSLAAGTAWLALPPASFTHGSLEFVVVVQLVVAAVWLLLLIVVTGVGDATLVCWLRTTGAIMSYCLMVWGYFLGSNCARLLVSCCNHLRLC